MIDKLKGFFQVSSDLSMARLITFICSFVGAVSTLAAIPLAFQSKLTIEYISFVASLWAAAFGGKNWAKKVESKHLNAK